MLPFHEQTDFEFMPQISRYSDQQVEQLLSELTNVLESHKAPVDLSLMVLGNMVTNLINSSVAPAQLCYYLLPITYYLLISSPRIIIPIIIVVHLWAVVLVQAFCHQSDDVVCQL